MSQKTYMYDTQWTALINAIDGGDTSAIATALGQIKTSIDSIETALGSLSTDVTQDSTQWNNLINAISSGGGGGGGTIDIDATQWSDLLTEIAKGDMTATVTALGNIKTSIDNVYTRLNSIGFDTTQWGNLVNAITNQSLTVDLSNVTSSAVSNLSNLTGSTVTDVLNLIGTLINGLDQKLDGGLYFRGTLGTNVLTTAKNNPIGIVFYANSNNPASQPSGCSWGCYMFIKDTSNRTAIIYFDSSHLATAYTITDSTTSITWRII